MTNPPGPISQKVADQTESGVVPVIFCNDWYLDLCKILRQVRVPDIPYARCGQFDLTEYLKQDEKPVHCRDSCQNDHDGIESNFTCLLSLPDTYVLRVVLKCALHEHNTRSDQYLVFSTMPLQSI